MRILAKLLAIWAMGRTVTSTMPLLLQLAVSVAAIAFLSMFILLLAMTLIIGSLWGIHSLLLDAGVTPLTAGAVVFLLIIIMMLVAALAIQSYIHRIKIDMREITFAQAPVTGRVAMVADAFLRGFNQTGTTKP